MTTTTGKDEAAAKRRQARLKIARQELPGKRAGENKSRQGRLKLQWPAPCPTIRKRVYLCTVPSQPKTDCVRFLAKCGVACGPTWVALPGPTALKPSPSAA